MKRPSVADDDGNKIEDPADAIAFSAAKAMGRCDEIAELAAEAGDIPSLLEAIRINHEMVLDLVAPERHLASVPTPFSRAFFKAQLESIYADGFHNSRMPLDPDD